MEARIHRALVENASTTVINQQRLSRRTLLQNAQRPHENTRNKELVDKCKEELKKIKRKINGIEEVGGRDRKAAILLRIDGLQQAIGSPSGSDWLSLWNDSKGSLFLVLISTPLLFGAQLNNVPTDSSFANTLASCINSLGFASACSNLWDIGDFPHKKYPASRLFFLFVLFIGIIASAMLGPNWQVIVYGTIIADVADLVKPAEYGKILNAVWFFACVIAVSVYRCTGEPWRAILMSEKGTVYVIIIASLLSFIYSVLQVYKGPLSIDNKLMFSAIGLFSLISLINVLVASGYRRNHIIITAGLMFLLCLISISILFFSSLLPSE
uniref:MFS general substrate transporter n=1 Tax=Caenorhabditis tropicalis TaxID=1561998 RepID=A0A1I7T2N5_9PELO